MRICTHKENGKRCPYEAWPDSMYCLKHIPSIVVRKGQGETEWGNHPLTFPGAIKGTDKS